MCITISATQRSVGGVVDGSMTRIVLRRIAASPMPFGLRAEVTGGISAGCRLASPATTGVCHDGICEPHSSGPGERIMSPQSQGRLRISSVGRRARMKPCPVRLLTQTLWSASRLAGSDENRSSACRASQQRRFGAVSSAGAEGGTCFTLRHRIESGTTIRVMSTPSRHRRHGAASYPKIRPGDEHGCNDDLLHVRI